MRDMVLVAFVVAVLVAAWTQLHHAAPSAAEPTSSMGAARAYCDTGYGFQPCAAVEPDGAET